MTVSVRPLVGDDLAEGVDALARLRIAVFRHWPYLYDGDPAYEARYLASYGNTPAAVMVGAWDGDQLVGAATGMPLLAHREAAEGGHWPEDAPPLSRIFYCAESVLLPRYRGQGIGHIFFDYREELAREQGFHWCCFASVIRPDSHPLKPAGYRPLDPFWRKRGYAPLPGAVERFRWKDIGEAEETEKELQIWLRAL